jgi:hypothetical protein
MKIREIQEALKVASGTAYKWKKYLEENELEVTVENLQELDKHIRKEHKLEGFAEAFKKRQAEAAAAAEAAVNETAIAVSEPAIATASQQDIGSEVATTRESSSSSAANPDNPNPLIRKGKERAAAHLMAIAHIAERVMDDPNLLDEDLLTAVQETWKKTAPKSSTAAEVAALAMSMAAAV